jgi:hypothetical protein
MYKHIELLPPLVKAALPDKNDQTQWAQEFNKAYKVGQYEDAMAKAFEAFKDNPNCRYFEGWLSVDGVDKQGDVMDQKALNKALKKFVARGGTLVDTHTNRVTGGLFSAQLKKFDEKYEGNFGKGVIFQGEPYFDHVWGEIKKGDKNSFSIGGFGLSFSEVCDGWDCHRRVNDESIHEMSVCRTPAHPEANMTHFNSIAKADTVEIPKKHLKDDGKMFDDIEAHANGILKAVHELKSDDSAAEGGVEPIEKVGTEEGACRHHRQHNHRMTSKCTGLALDVDGKEAEEPDDVRQPDPPKEKPKEYTPVSFVDEEKKKREHARANQYVYKHSGVKRANNQQAKAMADKVRAMMPAGAPDDSRACYERAIRILSDNSGLPVSKRLSIINSGAKSGCEQKTASKITARLRQG